MLASNAQRIVRPEELEGANAVDLKGYVSRGFLHFSRGLRYRIALGGAAAQARAVDIEIQGRPLAEVRERRFRVLFGSYIGNGGFAEAWNGREIAGLGGIRGYDLTRHAKRDTGFVYRNEVVAQIRQIGVIRPEHGARLDGRLAVSA
jgi:5'-nucleotidase/5'-nucleotidase/UDP-sugar diphosphatase